MRHSYEQAIENERRRIAEYENNIDQLQSAIKSQKQVTGGVQGKAQSQLAMSKQVKILENRLDQANQKFNQSISMNKELRADIDSLRRERVIFDNLYKKLEKELHEKRKNMASIIESANTAYEERDKANEHIDNLKQQAKRETNDFERELKEISHAMVKSQKALDYIKMTKAQGEESEKTAEKEAEQIRRQTQRLKNDRASNDAAIEKIQRYEEDLAKIQAATHITDFDKLVQTFVKNEEKNYAAFRYVNDLSNEMETLERNIAELKEERVKYDNQPASRDSKKFNDLKNLENNLSKLEGKMEFYEFQHHEATKSINSCCNWIESLYNSLDCAKIAPRDIVSHGVTESNLMTYFSVIEERANQIIQAYTTKKQVELSVKTPIEYLTNASVMKVRQEVPSFDEYSDDDGDGDKPLTMEEFMQKAMMKLESNNKPTMPKNKSSYGSSKRR